MKHKPLGSHTSELMLQEVCPSTCHSCIPSFIHSSGHLATQSANMESVMLVGAVGSSKKYNTWSCSLRARKSVDATGDMHKQPQYKTEGSKRWIWRVGDVKNAQRKKRPNKDWEGGKHYSEEGGQGKLLRGGSILVGAGSAEYRAQVWGRGLSRQGDVSWAQSLAPVQGAAPSRPSRLALWVGFRGASPVSFFGGTVLITFERQPTSCPLPSDPGPRGNAFLLFSVAKDSGFPAPTSKGPCTFSRVSCSIPCLPSGNLPPDAPLGGTIPFCSQPL